MNHLVVIGSGAIARATLIAIAKKRPERFSCTLIARNVATIQEISEYLRKEYHFSIETEICDASARLCALCGEA